MATYSKEFLTGATGDGRGLIVAATVTTGDIVHTAHATAKDELHLWGFNTEAATDRTLTLEWGDVTVLGDTMEFVIPFTDGLVPLVSGLILSGSDVVRAFASTTNVITVFGFVNRIT